MGLHVDYFEQERGRVGEGWWPIVNALHSTIEALAPGTKILQIKEKFGGLRYYYSLPDDTPDLVRTTAHVMVEAAEALSYRTCEWCGEPGSLRNQHHWYVTLCDKHAAERMAQREQEMAERAERRTLRDMHEVTEPDPEKAVDPDCTCWSPEGGHDADCAVWTRGENP